MALCIVAVPLVRTLLGAKWHDAGVVLALLAPSLAAVGFGYAAGDLFISQNRSRELRTLGIVDMVARVAAILFGVQFGIYGAAVGFSVASILMAFVRVAVAGRQGPVGTRDQLRAGLPGILLGTAAAIGAGVGLTGAMRLTLTDLTSAILGLSLGGLFALVGGLFVPVTRRALVDLAEALGLGKIVALAGLPRPQAD
jgi:PST family polysaccharide transporter